MCVSNATNYSVNSKQYQNFILKILDYGRVRSGRSDQSMLYVQIAKIKFISLNN